MSLHLPVIRSVLFSVKDSHSQPREYCKWLRRCLHDTRSSFIPVRLHPGSILSIYICLHDTNQNCIQERVIPERLHPGSRIGSKFLFQNEICLHVPPMSCKGGTGSFRYGNKQVDWLGWPADSCFRSVDAFTAFSFQNENVHVNVKQTMRVVLEWNSFRYHVNTTLIKCLNSSFNVLFFTQSYVLVTKRHWKERRNIQRDSV